MAIYNLYIFDRNGHCVYYVDWLRLKTVTVNKDEEAKLLYGMVLSLKSFVSKLSPTADNRTNFRSFLTSTYKATLFETATGMRIIMTTDRAAAGIYELLRQIYAEEIFGGFAADVNIAHRLVGHLEDSAIKNCLVLGSGTIRYEDGAPYKRRNPEQNVRGIRSRPRPKAF